MTKYNARKVALEFYFYKATQYTHTNPVFSVTDIQLKENKFWRRENLGFFEAMWGMNWICKRCPTGAYKYRSCILSEKDQSLYLREHFLFRVKQEHNQQMQHDLMSHITSFSKSNQIYKLLFASLCQQLQQKFYDLCFAKKWIKNTIKTLNHR